MKAVIGDIIKVISNFHDYYDSVLKYGADDDLLMVRKTVEHGASPAGAPRPPTPFDPLIQAFSGVISFRSWRDEKVFNATRDWSSLTVEIKVVLFVGIAYPAFYITRTSKYYPYTAEKRYVYDPVELDSVLLEHGAKSIYERTKSYRFSNEGYKSWALTAYDRAKHKSYVEKASELNAPIILFEDHGKCIVYPRLKDLQFFKVVEPWRAYQELSMFLGNIAAPDRTPVTLSDKDRVNQHGFDLQYGFRKRPRAD